MEKQTLKTREDCLKCLADLEIPYKLHEHEAVFTMEELSQVKLEKSPHVKNLFYSDKKSKGYYLIIADNATVVERGTSFIN